MTLTAPRWGTPRSSAPTRGDRAVELAVEMGFDLFEWQRYVFDVALEYDEATGLYLYRTAGVEVGRQNGKTLGAVVRIGLELEQPNHHVAFTAQDRNMAREKWEEHVELLEASSMGGDIKNVVLSNGREHVVMNNGSTYSIFTPSRKGARGKTLDLVMIDEALTHSKEVLDAVGPTMLTRPNAQIWLLSNAGDESSELLSHFRELGHRDHDPAARLAWFEWAPLEDRIAIDDEAVWLEAIPTLAEEHGVTIEGVRSLMQTMKPDDFAREVLNVWPNTSAITVIDPDTWAALEEPDLIAPAAGNTFGIDVTPDRDHASIAVCGFTRGRPVVEIVESRERVGWVVDRAAELSRTHRGTFVIDGGSPAGALIADLEQKRVKLEVVGMGEYVKACSMFYDHVADGTLAHRAQWQLDDAVSGATKRRLGDGWAWNRRGEVLITPVVAATLAMYGAKTLRQQKPRIV